MARHPRRVGSCGTCFYWEPLEEIQPDYQVEGLCRRRAPLATPSSTVQANGESPDGRVGCLARWPRTFAESDWCGEFVVSPDLTGRFRERDADTPTREHADTPTCEQDNTQTCPP
jgi:hypothetical protein